MSFTVNQAMNRKIAIKLLCYLFIVCSVSDDFEDDDNEGFTDDELGTVAEDMSEYQWQGSMRYKTLWRPRHCDVKTRDGDDVTMTMEYYAVRETGMGVELEKAVVMQLKKGQTINDVKDALLGICLGEKRRLLIEDRNLWNKFAEILPEILDEIQKNM